MNIRNLQTKINALDQSNFKNKNSQTPLTNKLSAVINALNAGDYVSALDQLQNDHIKKTDGCASTAKQPDANDWTINCDAQGQLDPELLYIVEEINALQTP